MTINEIPAVTNDELLATAELLARKLSAFELLGQDSKEFLSEVTCMEAAALGFLGSFTPAALRDRGFGDVDGVPAEVFNEAMDSFLAVQNELVARGFNVRTFRSKDLSPYLAQQISDQVDPKEEPKEWTYGGHVISRDIQEAFPNLEWEFERPSANSLVARSGPLTIDCDDSLPEMFGITLEFPGIPAFDFRSSSVAEARSVLMELWGGIAGLMVPDPFAL